MIARLLAMRDQAQAQHDWSMVVEIDAQLDRLGYRRTEPAAPIREKAVNPPVKRARKST